MIQDTAEKAKQIAASMKPGETRYVVPRTNLSLFLRREGLVPGHSLNYWMKPMILTETDREVFGNDTRAINRHSTRTYETDDGRVVVLDRTLDMCPPAFEIHGPYAKTFVGVTPTTKVDGQRFFCDGKSWKAAVAKMCEVLSAKVA